MIVFQVSSSVSNFGPLKEILKIRCHTYILMLLIFKDFLRNFKVHVSDGILKL